MEKDLELIKAFELSIIKWNYIVNHSNANYDLNMTKMLNVHPELEKLNAYCGLCEYNYKFKEDKCSACPIAIAIKIKIKIKKGAFLYFDEIGDNTAVVYTISFVGCSYYSHPFSKWRLDKTKEKAQAVLDLIKKEYQYYIDFVENWKEDEDTKNI